MALVITACGQTAPATDLELMAGFEAQIFAEGFVGPTQMIVAANGDLIIAELNGAENDATGRIIRVDHTNVTDRTVLQEGLDKPTGLAVVGDRLWIMERQRLSVTDLVPGAEREIVVEELPFNGRSQGTLSVTEDGRLLYNTSGAKRGAERVAGSGMIFAIDDAAYGGRTPTVIARGFKHAYATLEAPDGQLWSVEMTDGTFDGERGSDELVPLSPGDDAGWPQCVDDNRPVVQYGGTAAMCALSPRSHALFDPGATPTSFVIAPWDPDQFVVALWLSGRVVTVPRTATVGQPHEPKLFIGGITSPQHLVVEDDRVLVSDHETGAIYAITAE